MSPKENVPRILLSGVVSKYKCGDCSVTYYGKSKHHLKPKFVKGLHILLAKKMKVDKNNPTVF